MVHAVWGPGHGRSVQLAALAIFVLAAGCASYQIGTRSLYRPDIQTIHVPVFESDSFRRNLGERLTEAVIKEIEERTPYNVVSNPAADSVLTGRLVSETKRVISINENDQPRDIEMDLTVTVSWYDRRGSQIMQEATFPFTPLTRTLSQNANFIPEGGQSIATAHQEAIERAARQIVGQMEIQW